MNRYPYFAGMILNDILLLLILLIAMFLSVKAQKLTVAGALTGGILGFLIFVGAGFCGIAMVGAFFLLGVLATSWKMSEKQSQKLAEENKGKRTAGQVVANAGVAGLLGLLIYIVPEKTSLFQIMMAASLASATADTLSSELGVVYGKKFFNIVTFQKDQKGADGVISIEGTLIGVLGSVIIAIIYATGFGWSISVLWIVIAGTAGNLSDSLMGATLERSHYLGNNAVNFLNTLIGALVVLLLVVIS